MATTDVVTYAIQGESIKNGTSVVMCFNTGNYISSSDTQDISASYETLETLYTDRFDDVGYYNAAP